MIFLILLGLIINSRKFILLALFPLLGCSFPPISGYLISSLEKNYELQDVSVIPNADAIVLLSGFVVPVKTDIGYSYEWSEASDRLLLEFHYLKRTKLLILF